MLGSRSNSEASGKRLNIVLPEQTVERINKLKNMTAASSVTDVIRTAILTYEALVEFLSDGNKFYLKNGSDSHFVPVQFLFDVKRNYRADQGNIAQPEQESQALAERVSSN
ncbi:MAG: ribbon-helix-helix protein, CopG family [Rhodomicrobiaceae bacterium]